MKFVKLSVFVWLMLYVANSFATDLTIDELIRGNFEHKSKTLSALDLAFKEHRVDYLKKVSTSKFRRSRWYKVLQGYVKTRRLNLNHTSETATQEFIINRNERHVLVVDFDKSNKTNMWYIADAYVMKNGRKKQNALPEQGFRPLQYDSSFSELVNNIKRGRIGDYLGLAPHGKLNQRFLNKNQLSLSKRRSIKIKNVIIHDGRKITDMIFLTLKYYSAGHRDGSTHKSGWLLVGGGSMSTLYKEDLYVDYLFKGAKSRRLNLNKPNQGVGYSNLRAGRKSQGGNSSSIWGGSEDVAEQSSGGISRISCGDHPKKGFFRIAFYDGNQKVFIDSMLQNQTSITQEDKLILAGKTNRLQLGSCLSYFWPDGIQSFDDRLEIDLSKLGDIQRYKLGKPAFYIDLYYNR